MHIEIYMYTETLLFKKKKRIIESAGRGKIPETWEQAPHTCNHL